MLLTELLGVKKFKDLTPPQLVRLLKSELGAASKMRFLGHGTHGVALTDGKVVFKFWLKDDAYEDFVRFCLTNKSNRWLPKFLSPIKTMPAFFKLSDDGRAGSNNRLKYVKMELLEPWRGRTDFQIFKQPKLIAASVKRGLDNYIDLDTLVEWGIDGVSLIDVLKRHNKNFDFAAHEADINQELKEVYDVIQQLNVVAGPDGSFDLTSHNLASRNGQLVFLDPLASGAGLDYNAIHTNLYKLL